MSGGDALLLAVQDLDTARGLLRSVGVALGLCYCHECAATAPAAMLGRIEELKRAVVERDGARRVIEAEELDALEQAARAAAEAWERWCASGYGTDRLAHDEAREIYDGRADPAVVLELIAEVRRARGEVVRASDATDWGDDGGPEGSDPWEVSDG